MARRIQFRRGSAIDHETFTGAQGEITVDTTNNTLRVHDGLTPGGTSIARADQIPDMTSIDYVEQWQNPTEENNYTWYRKYKSGWVEQGGLAVVEGYATTSSSNITLPVEMSDMNYTVVATLNGAGENVGVGNSVLKKSTAAISLRINFNSTLKRTMSWLVCGMSA